MQCSAPLDRKPDCLTLEGGLGTKLLNLKLEWCLNTPGGSFGAVSGAVLGCVWLRSGDNTVLLRDSAQMPPRSRAGPRLCTAVSGCWGFARGF